MQQRQKPNSTFEPLQYSSVDIGITKRIL